MHPDKRSGITLIEAIISTVIAALIFVAASRMMISAMQISRTGSSHLTNLLAADMVLQQILQDLKQATALVSDETQLATGNLELEKHYWENDSANPSLSAISYRLPEDGRGLLRKSEGEEHRFYPDRRFNLTCRRVETGPQHAVGLLLELSVSTPPEETEKHIFKRFVYLESLPENRALINDYLPVEL